MTEVEPHRFYAWADAEGRGHGRVLEAGSYEAAAVAYIERHAPAITAQGEIRVFVTGLDDGREHCFTVDLDGGVAAPCG